MQTAKAVAEKLQQGFDLADELVVLDLHGYKIGIRSNSTDFLNQLRQYFSHVLGSGPVNDEVVSIDTGAIDTGFEFIDWQREPGKSGRKDAYVDLADGRLVLKVRTGMLFLQNENYRIAIGPCRRYDNQVINFINAQYMNWLQQHNALICHASGLVINDSCLGIAGFSGGGKSTLMLHMLEKNNVRYLTNDRLFLHKAEAGVLATGIPKLPRINPGTIVHNPLLRPILSNQRCDELLAMPKHELWHLEEKYDVDVEKVFGKDKIVQQQKISAFLILSWRFDSDQPCHIQPVDIAVRRDLLKAVMKSPGPFYQFSDGSFYTDDMQQNEEVYLDYLQGINIFEATGSVDFPQATAFCFQKMNALEDTLPDA